jgi:hypothetical protein
MRRHLAYLKYVLRHKWFVFLACFRMRVPIWIAILHDWDKFLPDEWFPYTTTFYNKDGSKRYIEFPEFADAWNAHQKRNKHHWQYWMLTWDRGETECLPMPDVYRREMIADWIGAGRALGKPNTWEWYAENRDKMKLHPDTRAWVDEQIVQLKADHDLYEKVKGMGII